MANATLHGLVRLMHVVVGGIWLQEPRSDLQLTLCNCLAWLLRPACSFRGGAMELWEKLVVVFDRSSPLPLKGLTVEAGAGW